MNRRALQIDLSESIRIWAPALPTRVYDNLKIKFTRLAATFSNQSVGNADIVIRVNNHIMPNLPDQAYQMHALYGFWVTEYQGLATAFFIAKGQTVFQISFGQTVNIIFADTKNIDKRLYTILQFCIRYCLHTKGKLLIHGAAFEKDGKSLILLGQRGIRKTMITLTMLKNDWSYVADDKFILHQGNVSRYQDKLLIRDHHFDALPWLAQIIPSSKQLQRWRKLRGWLRTQANLYLPSKFLPNEDRLFNKGHNLLVDSIFPNNPLTRSIGQSKVCILLTGEKLSLTSIDKPKAMQLTNLLQRLANSEFNDLQDMLALQENGLATTFTEQLSTQFPDNDYYTITVPTTSSVEAICQLLSDIDKCRT